METDSSPWCNQQRKKTDQDTVHCDSSIFTAHAAMHYFRKGNHVPRYSHDIGQKECGFKLYHRLFVGGLLTLITSKGVMGSKFVPEAQIPRIKNYKKRSAVLRTAAGNTQENSYCKGTNRPRNYFSAQKSKQNAPKMLYAISYQKRKAPAMFVMFLAAEIITSARCFVPKIF